MKQTNSDEARLRRYLLGQTTADEQRSVEQRLLADQNYFQELLQAEEDLTDDYVQGHLEQLDTRKFEQYFLRSPERRKNVEFAQALARYVSTHGERENSPRGVVPTWRRVSEATLLCATAVVSVALALQLHRGSQLREQLVQVQIQSRQAEEREQTLQQQLQQERNRSARLAAELTSRTSIHSGAAGHDFSLASLVLTPGLDRDGGSATAHLDPAILRLQLELKMEEAVRGGYHVELQTGEGKSVWVGDRLKARKTGHGYAVRVLVPTKLLDRSDYLVVVSVTKPAGASDKVATYYFRVQR